MTADSCIFCRILRGELPGTFVYRDDTHAAIMDIRPVNPGHLLVIPVEHAPHLADLAARSAARLMELAHGLAAGLRASGLRCEGVNLFLADGEAAMQEVFHVHLHVFPRFQGDGFGLRFGPDYVVRERDELEAAGARIRAALAPAAPAAPAESDSTALARGWIEAWQRMDLAWLREHLAPDFVHTSPFGRLEGRDPYLAVVEPMARKSVQELLILEVTGFGNQAAIWFENRTPAGVVPSCDWVRVEQGRIVEIQSFYDSTTVRRVLSPEEQDGLGG